MKERETKSIWDSKLKWLFIILLSPFLVVSLCFETFDFAWSWFYSEEMLVVKYLKRRWKWTF